MDVHFNAYKAKYDTLNEYLKKITESQYVRTVNIFVNIDDVYHNLHRPLINNEFQVAGQDAAKQLVSNSINLLAHYKQWCARQKIHARVFGIYTTRNRAFKNEVFIHGYRKKFITDTDPENTKFYFINGAIRQALPIFKNIGDYIADIFVIDSRYLEPSIIPGYLSQLPQFKDADWNFLISRDPYDFQYAYRGGWTLVSPKGENTTIVNSGNLWHYMALRESVYDEKHSYHPEFYDHNIYPLALAVAGNKFRSIPRLKRVGWKTIFQYLESCTADHTEFLSIVTSRFMDLLDKKRVPFNEIDDNLACVSVDRQIAAMNEIDKVSINDQLKFVTDHEALSTINDMYFSRFPLNIQFLVANWENGNPFRKFS